MGDEQRIATADHCESDQVENICMELRAALPGHWSDHPCRSAELRPAFMAGQAAERIRVVEGLVATIKALPANHQSGNPRFASEMRADVLAVVEAAREDVDG